MRRDSIFYALFKRSPSLLFELLENVPDSADGYRFESVAVKDERLYERMFGESMAYFYRNRDYHSDWQAVVIYPARSTEQKDCHPYRALLNSDQVHRVYLNELGAMATLPLGVAAMVLTIAKEAEAAEQARMLIGRANQEVSSLTIRQGIIEMVSTIITYKFTNLSRQEIDAMLGTKFEETRVYRETREEGKEAGKEETQLAIALNLLKEGIPIEVIARTIALTIEQLQKLQAQNN